MIIIYVDRGRPVDQAVVLGDRGTGKSSLIATVATDSFPEKSPRVLPPTRLPNDFYPYRVPLTILDTSSDPGQKDQFPSIIGFVEGSSVDCGCKAMPGYGSGALYGSLAFFLRE